MRKLLLFIVAIFIGTLSLFADEKTVTITTSDALWTEQAGKQSGSKDGVTIETTNGMFSTQYRSYKNSQFTVSVTEGKITAIELTCDKSTKYAPSGFTKIEGSYSCKDNIGSWTGSAESVTLVATYNQVRMEVIKVTYTISEDFVPAPTITPEKGIKFDGTQKVTITPANPSHTIWYTIDGSVPTNAEPSIGYTGPFTIDATTTVKAIATDGTNMSDVTTATYTKVEAIDGLAALVAKIKGDASTSNTEYYVNLTDAVVTGVFSKYAYIEEDGMAVYLNQSGHALKVGQKYSGLATVSAKMNYGLPQLTAFACENVAEGATLPLETVTLADLTANYDTYLYRRVKVEDVTVAEAFVNQNGSVSQSEVSMNVYAQGGTDITMAVNDVIDMVAFPNMSSSNQQLNVLAQEDITVKTAAPVFYFATDAVSVRIGGDVEEPVLTNTYGEAPEYSSSNIDVATVNASTGEVTIVGEGETTITAKLVGANQEAFYTLTITGIPVKGSYYLVKSEDGLVAGERYLIVCTSKKVVIGAQTGSYRSGVAVTISDKVIGSVLPDGAHEMVLEKKYDGWAFYDPIDDAYLYWESGNSVETGAYSISNSGVNIVITETYDAIITSTKDSSRKLRWNASSPRFAYYSSSEQTQIQLYKYCPDFTIGTDGYASFYTDKAFVMPEGVTGGIITAAEGDKLVIAYNYPAGSTVPAKTALLLKGATGNYAYDFTTTDEEAPASNLLHGADAVDADGKTFVAGTDVKYYALSKKNGANLGFYWRAENGAAFPYQAGKAFLAVDNASGVREFFGFDDIETGIDNVESTTQVENGKIYTLTGIYVGTNMKALPKGIYIVNGKRVAY